MNNSLPFILLLMAFVSGCGKALSFPAFQVECTRKWVGTQECIVCEGGGVSCRW